MGFRSRLCAQIHVCLCEVLYSSDGALRIGICLPLASGSSALRCCFIGMKEHVFI